MDLDFPVEVDRARLNCLRRWTEKRLNTLVITLPERDPYRLLCEELVSNALTSFSIISLD